MKRIFSTLSLICMAGMWLSAQTTQRTLADSLLMSPLEKEMADHALFPNTTMSIGYAFQSLQPEDGTKRNSFAAWGGDFIWTYYLGKRSPTDKMRFGLDLGCGIEMAFYNKTDRTQRTYEFIYEYDQWGNLISMTEGRGPSENTNSIHSSIGVPIGISATFVPAKKFKARAFVRYIPSFDYLSCKHVANYGSFVPYYRMGVSFFWPYLGVSVDTRLGNAKYKEREVVAEYYTDSYGGRKTEIMDIRISVVSLFQFTSKKKIKQVNEMRERQAL